jgi:transcriptional regulator GlxA family with amidase domain
MKKNLFSILFFLYFITASFGQTAKNDSLAKRHQAMMDIMMTKPKVAIKTIGILIYDGYQTLDVMGPYEVLSNLSGAKVILIAKQKGLIRNQKGLKIQVDTSIADVEKLDILVIPGGAAETFLMSQDTTVLNWIRKIDKTTTYTTSVCTGAWILGATGLLKGKNATTNWYRAEEMLKNCGANFKQERWVKDGKYWTSAGVTAGMDMSLAIVNDLMGEKYTQAIMLNFEYDPKPPLNAGSILNTDKLVIDMMYQMYDSIFLPLFDKKSKK